VRRRPHQLGGLIVDDRSSHWSNTLGYGKNRTNGEEESSNDCSREVLAIFTPDIRKETNHGS
jgi:hypothetical protein